MPPLFWIHPEPRIVHRRDQRISMFFCRSIWQRRIGRSPRTERIERCRERHQLAFAVGEREIDRDAALMQTAALRIGDSPWMRMGVKERLLRCVRTGAVPRDEAQTARIESARDIGEAGRDALAQQAARIGRVERMPGDVLGSRVGELHEQARHDERRIDEGIVGVRDSRKLLGTEPRRSV